LRLENFFLCSFIIYENPAIIGGQGMARDGVQLGRKLPHDIQKETPLPKDTPAKNQ
jgi:hypothetical protein